MTRFSHSRIECFDRCRYQFFLRYIEDLKTLPDDAADNALYLGSALHKGIETDLETARKEYFSHYPMITDQILLEWEKLEYLIPKVKETIPEGAHEVEIQNDYFHGFLDLMVPATRLDDKLPNGQYDIYDFKYSNSVDHYLKSGQLSIYKYFAEKIMGKHIRKLYFVFIPKVKTPKGDDIGMIRKQIQTQLQQAEIRIEEVPYDPKKVLDWFGSVMEIQNCKDYPKNPSYLCRWCEFSEYCQKGIDYMILPSTQRREIGSAKRRRIWIYGAPFSGKTTMVDKAPTPLNLNTDGNVNYVTMPVMPIKDIFEGRQRKLAWEVFKEAIDELSRGGNGFKTIVVDLLEDTYQSCRVYIYSKLGIDHESDAGYGKGYDEVRTEFLTTIRKLMNLDYENIVLISHEDTSRDITKRSGDKITSIQPNLPAKIANKVAGMCDLVGRVIVTDGDKRILSFKQNDMVFGGGRLTKIENTEISLDWFELEKVFEKADEYAGVENAMADGDYAELARSSKETDNLPSEKETPVLAPEGPVM